MNMQQSVLKISVISLGLLCNGALFGMKCNYNGSLVINNKKITYKTSYDKTELPRASDFDPYEVDYQQPQTFLPIEIIETAAACAHDDTKSAVKMTCKHFHRAVSTDNIMFVSNPLFIADKKKIHKIAIVNSWKQNIPMI